MDRKTAVLILDDEGQPNPDPNPEKLECVGDIMCKKKASPSTSIKPNSSNNNKTKSGSSCQLIQKLHSQQDLLTLLNSKEDVIVEFMTTWCSACAGIEPLFEELAQSAAEQNGPQAAQVVCDKNKETKKLAESFSVGSYPVFVVFENGNESSRWRGADRGKLEKAFDRGDSGGRGGKGKKKKGGKGRK